MSTGKHLLQSCNIFVRCELPTHCLSSVSAEGLGNLNGRFGCFSGRFGRFSGRFGQSHGKVSVFQRKVWAFKG